MISEKTAFNRTLLLDIPATKSAFLWGARKTGKSTYLKKNFPDAIYYDLLKSDIYLAFLKTPHLFREAVLSLSAAQLRHPIIVDEVQKIPALLDEIHWLIENTAATFILCGSSTRKLKRMGANLLGGRAWRYHFCPLTSHEIPNFDLLHAFNTGLIPAHYRSENPWRELESYVDDYLQLEIQAEGATRNLPAFARFLDALAFSSGTLINFSNIARDCGIDAKTVKEYFHVLADTMMGYFVLPYAKKTGRHVLTAMQKFYLFDIGLLSYLAKQSHYILKGPEAGRVFEHFILMELHAYLAYSHSDDTITFWRTTSGVDVDFVIGDATVAIEVTRQSTLDKSDFKGLGMFLDTFPTATAHVVAMIERPRVILLSDHQKIHLWPWPLFLQKLWNNEILAQQEPLS